jgi:glycerol-3-phosphate O-acyltransferase
MEALIHAVNEAMKAGTIPKQYAMSMAHFSQTYLKACGEMGSPRDVSIPLMATFLELIVKQCRSPYSFELFNPRQLEPFNYHKFGLDFWRPVINLEESRLIGEEVLERATAQLANGENVVFLGNHQTEIDPQLIDLALEKRFKKLGNEMIFVAGARVITDPMAVPFSLGLNLLCIYSKRYIDNPPEDRHRKQTHNQKTMARMRELLREGGHSIYVAPSGGRDRQRKIADFNPQSIEMFRLMARRAGTPCHFYPLALATHNFLAPPDTIQESLGEVREVNSGPILIGFGEELDLESYPGSDATDRQEKRAAFARYAQSQVESLYSELT